MQLLRERIIAVTGFGLGTGAPDLAARGIERQFVNGPEANHRVSYLSAGDPTGTPVLFIHGSPGAGEEWINFLSHVPAGQYRIAIDRPGFGKSPTERPVVALADQADAIERIIDARPPEKVFLVGYSYGGPVALELAVERADAVGGVLLVGSAADPGLEKIYPLQELLASDPFQRVLPSQLANSNAELIALKAELEILSRKLAQLTSAVSIVHGIQDGLVPVENAWYLKDHLRNSSSTKITIIERANHFIPWSYPGHVEKALACLIREAKAADG